ncbi:MAG: MEDS domain-containing protein [Actinomycetota bacterium]|nr:MEDS domain-containing protein [Actinomycetota bacterium]
MTSGVDRPITVARELGTVVVTVHGDFDLACSSRVGAVLGDLIDGQGNLNVSVDLSRLTSVDPAALGVFAAGAKLARHRGATLAVGGLPSGQAPRRSPPTGTVEAPVHHHLLEFYEADHLLADSVRAHVEPGLRGDDAVVVVATEAHRELFGAALSGSGVDVGAARIASRYLGLDAGEMLTRFMVDGAPDPGRFRTVIGEVIASVTGSGRRVRIYGEMVAVLWAEGDVSAAISVEDLWNDLGRTRPFSLLCAYPTTAFDRVESTGLLRTLCEQHSPVAATGA